ncbi:MAG: CD1247 N-terminal domain-containing protein [Acutalibacteraceae bacterium]|jgi:hypothetical protein|nr:hypothetical protein [Clostridiales bacterium]
MTAVEKVAYLRGLADGLNLNEDKSETKMFKAIMDVLDDIALSVSDLEDDVAILSEQIDAVDEDLDMLETIVYEELDDCDDDFDFDCDCGCGSEYYEVECPSCSEVICVDEGIIEEGSIECPSCGELLEFEIEFDDDFSDQVEAD